MLWIRTTMVCIATGTLCTSFRTLACSAEMCTRDTKYKHQLWTGRLYRRGLLWLSACIIIIYKREGRQHGGPEATRSCWPNEFFPWSLPSYFLWKVSTQIEQLQLPSGAS